MKIKFNNLNAQYIQIKKNLNKRFNNLFENSSFINGSEVEIFENCFKKYINTKYAIGVSNGTDALMLAAKSLELKDSTIAFIPANTFIATVLGIEQAIPNIKIELIDCNDDYLIDVNILQEKLEKYRCDYKNSIIVPVHLYGKACDMLTIEKLSNYYSSYIIEDVSQAHGAIINDRKVGSFGIASAFSLYPGKNLGAAGDAGIITTDYPVVEKRIKLLRNLGSRIKYNHEIKGFNHRLDSIQACVLSEKLKYLDIWNQKRIKIANKYIDNIKNERIILSKKSLNIEHVYHIFCIRTKERDKLINYLQKHEIETNIHYPILIEEMEMYKDLKAFNQKSRKFSKEILSLPIHPFMTNKEVNYVCEVLNKF